MESSLLSPGEKLRKLRKKYGFKQYELTGGKVSRNFISMVENGKANLTMRTAEVIARKANDILKNRKMDEIITAYELLESIEEQVNKAVDDYLSMLDRDDLTENEIEKAIKFTFNQELTDSVFLLNVKIGDFYFKRKDFSTAILFYMSFFYYTPQNNFGKKALETAFVKTFKLFYMSADFHKIIAAYNTLIKNQNILLLKSRRFVSEILIKSFFNIKDYKKALIYIEEKLKDKPLIEENSYKLKLIIRKGFSHYWLKNYNYALEAFETISQIRNFKESERQYKVIANIGIILVHLELLKETKVKEMLNQVENELQKIELDINNYYFIYMNLANIYYNLGNFDKAKENIEYYISSVNSNDFEEQLFSFYEIFKQLKEYYELSKDANILTYIKKLFANNSNEIIFVQNNEIILELLKFCLNNEFVDEAKEIAKYIK